MYVRNSLNLHLIPFFAHYFKVLVRCFLLDSSLRCFIGSHFKGPKVGSAQFFLQQQSYPTVFFQRMQNCYGGSINQSNFKFSLNYNSFFGRNSFLCRLGSIPKRINVTGGKKLEIHPHFFCSLLLYWNFFFALWCYVPWVIYSRMAKQQPKSR